jgi:parvulin-like peptidyl-prolyl isomerase
MKPPRPLLAASLALLSAPLALGEIVERVIVKVNGDIVTLSEFEARQVAAVQAARVPSDQISRFLRENNARILQEAIDELLIVQKAAEIGIRMRPESIKDVIDGIKKDNNIKSDEELQAQLRREGMTLDDLKRNVERSILRRQVLWRELESKVSVSEAEARADYEARKADFSRLPTVRLQEIFVRSEDGQAQQRARELVERVRGGEDFQALARAHSLSPTRNAGGELGRLTKGEMNPDIEKVAFALEPGAVSDPFASGDGYRILRLVEKTEGSVTPFEDVKAEVTRRLTQEKMAKEYDGFVAELRKTATIDVRVREVPLQVSVPSVSSPLLEPLSDPAPGAEPAAPRPAAGSAEAPEFSITGQEQPERVAPPPPARDEKKQPTPAPTPPPS